MHILQCYCGDASNQSPTSGQIVVSCWVFYLGVSENRGPQYSTLNSRILIIRTPKQGTPNFRKLTFLRSFEESVGLKTAAGLVPSSTLSSE